MTPAEKKDDGGPAFPYDVQRNGRGQHDGMSLRDWFAGQALAGLYASRELQMAVLHDSGGAGQGAFEPRMATAAYEMAYAMLAERSK